MFAGFTVYANEAENFVVRTKRDREIKLSLATRREMNDDGTYKTDENGSFIFTDKTSFLNLPASGEYINMTFTPNHDLKYDADKKDKNYIYNIPNDIAFYDGIHSGFNHIDQVTFYSFSFYLINESERPVDVNMYYNFESVTVSEKNDTGHHVDDAIKILYMEGEHLLWNKEYDLGGEEKKDENGLPVLTPGPFIVYSKEESSEENAAHLNDRISYEDKIIPFDKDTRYIFKREGTNGGFMGMAPGEYKKFTFVLWLEGEDADCDNAILGERMKMSIDFIGS